MHDFAYCGFLLLTPSVQCISDPSSSRNPYNVVDLTCRQTISSHASSRVPLPVLLLHGLCKHFRVAEKCCADHGNLHVTTHLVDVRLILSVLKQKLKLKYTSEIYTMMDARCAMSSVNVPRCKTVVTISSTSGQVLSHQLFSPKYTSSSMMRFLCKKKQMS